MEYYLICKDTKEMYLRNIILSELCQIEKLVYTMVLFKRYSETGKIILTAIPWSPGTMVGMHGSYLG